MLLDDRPLDRRPWHRYGLLHLGVTAFGLRPARNGRRGSCELTSSKSCPTGTCRTLASASRVSTVTFSSPRSTRPTYDRSMPDSRASRSCDSPCSTRSFRRFQPIFPRVPISRRQSHNHGLTIHGLIVPYLSFTGAACDSNRRCQSPVRKGKDSDSLLRCHAPLL